MDITMSRAATGGWQEATMPLGKVEQTTAMGSVFQKEKMGHPKHGWAKWYSRNIPVLATGWKQGVRL